MNFTLHHKQLFEEATGHNLEALCSEINALSDSEYQKIIGQDKHIFNNSLNEKGLQVFRALLAETVWIESLKKNNQYENKNTQDFIENGLLIKENFLEVPSKEQKGPVGSREQVHQV